MAYKFLFQIQMQELHTQPGSRQEPAWPWLSGSITESCGSLPERERYIYIYMYVYIYIS